MAQAQRESRLGQCALVLELVMDKVSTVLMSARVGARDHDTVSPSCGLTYLVNAIITSSVAQA